MIVMATPSADSISVTLSAHEWRNLIKAASTGAFAYLGARTSEEARYATEIIQNVTSQVAAGKLGDI